MKTLTIGTLGTYTLRVNGQVVRVGIPHTTAMQMASEGAVLA